ncbi:hypothetical protein GCM10027321_07040 [Massilia terrae]|uniref:Lipoprotein n=1 Tax=Massilia terrae TaxID=1811224 RepID=A0ABT2CSK7_9BURK|nr:hypothetical protein [Massilia terrae]MCS0656934.1 hypothetical protein [Massilia terrae]
MRSVAFFLVAAASVAIGGCGGGGSSPDQPIPTLTSATIGGAIDGVVGTVLLQNAGETLALTSSGSFQFSKPVTEGANYNVTLRGAPAGLVCKVSNASGSVAHGTASISVPVTCTGNGAIALYPFVVGVTVSGLLPGGSVTFSNNGADTLTVKENGLFVFATDYFVQSVYGGQVAGYKVTVQNNPAGQSCALTNSSGRATSSTNFINIAVNCK